MSNNDLPSRAKPEALHGICRHLKGKNGIERSNLYDDLDMDRRQIRASIDYGEKLGFLTLDGDVVKLAERGQVISYIMSIEEHTVKSVFQEAIKLYKPYRKSLLQVYAADAISENYENRCVLQDTFKKILQEIGVDDPSTRDINLLIKTVETAGLGEFVVGRRGKETRLKINDKFDSYVSELADKYDLPEISEEGSEEDESEETDQQANGGDREIESEQGSNNLKLTIEMDISDKSEDEIARVVKNIKDINL